MAERLKYIVIAFLATAAIALTASAAPQLLVETAITGLNDRGGTSYLNAPRVIVESGKQATVEIGDLIKFVVTPTLHEDGMADVAILVLTGKHKNPADQFTAPAVKAALGKPALVRIGQYDFTTTVYLPTVLSAQLGKRATLVGEAQSRTHGAALQGPDFCIWIEGLDRWPKQLADKQVSATGTVIERHDFPVFTEGAAKRPARGVAVPRGADLRQASHRFLLKDARWRAH